MDPLKVLCDLSDMELEREAHVGDGSLWAALVASLANARWEGAGAEFEKALAARELFREPKAKTPRTGRGFRQLPFAYSQLEVNVLAVYLGFEHSGRCPSFLNIFDTFFSPLTPFIYTINKNSERRASLHRD